MRTNNSLFDYCDLNSFKIDPLLPYISNNTLTTFTTSEELEKRVEFMQNKNKSEYLEDKAKVTKETLEYLRMILNNKVSV
jgi:hypothetical protein